MRKLDCDQKLYFRNELRDARAVALQDAEAFDEIVHVLERMGAFLRGEEKVFGTLYKFTKLINSEAGGSPLAEQIPSKCSDVHLSFSELYELVRDGRNKAMHDGSFARHLTFRAIELSIIFEHALMTDFNHVKHFMVENPICAALWQPLSFIRQSMLKNSFSYLPVSVPQNDKQRWQLISDLSVAQYLQTVRGEDLTKRLTQTLGEAVETEGIELSKTRICKPDDLVVDVLRSWNGMPVLIQSRHSDDLLGILTPFDLL